MRRYLWLLACVLLTPSLACAQAKAVPAILDRDPMLLDDDALLEPGAAGVAVLTEQGPITGYAFGPGRYDVAYCAPAGEGRWGLWLVNAAFAEVSPGASREAYRKPKTPARLLWTAPEGRTLRGPVWWSPSGTQLAVRAFDEEGRSTVMSVDYATGQAVALSSGREVVELAWSPDATQVALLGKTEAGAEVTLQRFPQEGRRVLAEGDGARDLRWSLDGKTLRWYRSSSGKLASVTWTAGTGEVREERQLPGRPAEAVFSPDGRLCAMVEGEPGRLTIYPAASPSGETVELPGVHARRVLGWSPSSRVVVLMNDQRVPIAVSAKRPAEIRDDIVRVLARDGLAYKDIRGSVVGPPLDPEAGPPSWSSNGDLLVYAWTSEQPGDFLRWRSHDQPESVAQLERDSTVVPRAARGLLAVSLVRRFVNTAVIEQADTARESLARGEAMKGLAQALAKYAADHGGRFPAAETGEHLRAALKGYLPEGSGQAELGAVRYLLPAGGELAKLGNPAGAAIVETDYPPNWKVVGFADGHTEVIIPGPAGEGEAAK